MLILETRCVWDETWRLRMMNFQPLISLRLDRARKFLGSWEEQPMREVRRVGVAQPDVLCIILAVV